MERGEWEHTDAWATEVCFHKIYDYYLALIAVVLFYWIWQGESR